jgi:hypothetical protein
MRLPRLGCGLVGSISLHSVAQPSRAACLSFSIAVTQQTVTSARPSRRKVHEGRETRGIKKYIHKGPDERA